VDKRRHNRSTSFQGIGVKWRSDGQYLLSRISDVSLGGTFIHTPEPAPVGTTLNLLLDAPSSAIQIRAVVRHSVPSEGMGVEFESMTSKDRVRLAAYYGGKMRRK
jgi:hypothetical protein